jgi:hypothetical protein
MKDVTVPIIKNEFESEDHLFKKGEEHDLKCHGHPKHFCDGKIVDNHNYLVYDFKNGIVCLPKDCIQ